LETGVFDHHGFEHRSWDDYRRFGRLTGHPGHHHDDRKGEKEFFHRFVRLIYKMHLLFLAIGFARGANGMGRKVLKLWH
jgi:hypothetical protein